MNRLTLSSDKHLPEQQQFHAVAMNIESSNLQTSVIDQQEELSSYRIMVLVRLLFDAAQAGKRRIDHSEYENLLESPKLDVRPAL